MTGPAAIEDNPQAVLDGSASLCDRAYAIIKERIVKNRIAAGSYLDERQLSVEFGMSRTPIREAFIRLQSEGFVAIEPHRGVKLLPISPHMMQEIYEVLTGLEVMAAALAAARRLTAEELAPMRTTLDTMSAALAAGDMEAWLHADERFHRTLLELSGNARLTETGLRFRDQIARAHLVVSRLHPGPERSTGAHEQLYAHLLAGDVDAARNAHYEQRVRAGRTLMATVLRVGLTQL